MIVWSKIILAILSIAEILLRFGQQQKWIAEGEQRAIAAASAEILRKTEYAKQALEELGHLSDSQLDDFLRKLEPE